MINKIFRLPLFLFIVSLPASVLAFDRDELDAALLSRIENGIGVGSVVGIIDGDKEEIITVGSGSKVTNRPLTKDSLMNIASLSKTFTGILLADMVLKKEIDLDTPVESYLPKHVSIPSYDGQKITIRHLATHRSALPLDPTNLRSNDKYNSRANYAVSDLYEYLSTYKLTRAPGETPEYSNTGIALLGHSLELITGKPFEVLLKQRVLIPLGMYQTTITVASDQNSISTSGHNQLQEVVDNGVLTAFAAPGGIKSTGHDMMRYMKANMGILETPLSAAVDLSHQVLNDYNAPGYSIGLCWFIREQGDLLYLAHRGAISGYRSSIGLYKGKKKGVFVMTNSFDKAWNIAWAIERNDIDSLIQKPIKTVLVSKAQLNKYAGTYRFDDDTQLILTAENGELFAQTPGQLKIRTLPVSNDEFVFTFVEGTIRFVTDRNGQVAHLVLTQDGVGTALKID